jgi:A/G-specific adenine glycosylase
VKTRFFNFIVFHCKNETLLEKRVRKDIWQHLYQFPLFETNQEIDDPISRFHLKGELKAKHLKKHVLSHQLIMGTFWWINVKALPTNNNYIRVDVNDLDNFPVPKIIENYTKENLAFHLE